MTLGWMSFSVSPFFPEGLECEFALDGIYQF